MAHTLTGDTLGRFATALVVALLLAPLSWAAEAETIRGQVTDTDGAPLSGATVRLLPDGLRMDHRYDPPSDWFDPIVLTTDEDGRFVSAALPRDQYSVRVEHAAAGPLTQFEIPRCAELTLRANPGRRIEAMVRDAASGEPLAEARVQVCDDDAGIFGEQACRAASTDERGLAVVDGLPRGGLRVRAVAVGHAYAEQRIRLPLEHDSPPILFELDLGARIAGLVRTRDGRPLERVAVMVRPDGPRAREIRPVRSKTITDDAGRFVLDGLPAPASYVPSAHREDWPRTRTTPLAIEPGESADDLQLILEPPAALQFRLVDDEEQPVAAPLVLSLAAPGARGVLSPSAHRIPDESVTRDETGGIHASPLNSDTRDVVIDVEGFRSVTRDAIRFESGETTDLGTIVLERGARLDGLVVDDDDLPVIGAQLEARQGRRGFRATSDADGRFEIDGLELAVLHVEANAAGHARSEPRATEPPFETLEIRLVRSGTLRGRVTSRGEPVPRYTLTTSAEAGSGGTHVGVKPRQIDDEDGRFEIADLRPGRYSVRIASERLAPTTRANLEISVGETTDLGEIELDAGLVIEGRVLNARDDAPIVGARVRPAREMKSFALINGRSFDAGATTTDPDGRFRLEGLLPGGQSIRAEHTEFAPAQVEVTLHADAIAGEVVIRLAGGGRVVGIVLDDAGAPMPRAQVVLTSSNAPLERPPIGQTGPDGRYTIDHVPAGSYAATRFLLDRGLEGHRSRQISVRQDETTVVDFGPEGAIQITGVTRRGSRTLPGRIVMFSRVDSNSAGSFRLAESDSQGRFQATLDEPGDYVAHISRYRGGSSEGSVRIVVPDAPQAEIDLVLLDNGVNGRVVDEASNGLGDAVVTAVRHGDDPLALGSRMTTVGDEGGGFRLEGLEPGAYRVTALVPGYRMGSIETFEITDVEPAPITLELQRGRIVRGVVLDPEGRPVPEAFVGVSLLGDAEIGGHGSTDLTGAFELTLPGDGPFDLSAIGAGWAPAQLRSWQPPPLDADGAGLTLRLDPGATLEISVVDAGGRTAEGIHVELRPVPAFAVFAIMRYFAPIAPTDEAGRTRARLLAAGLYEVTVPQRPGMAPGRVSVDRGGTASITLKLPE